MRILKTGLVALPALMVLAAMTTSAAADDYETCEKQSGDVAIAACSRAIAAGTYKGRQLAALYDNRGVEYANKQDYARAVADYNEAIRLDPNFTFPYSNRGDARRHTGDLDQALTDLDHALQLDPNYANAYFNRGLVWETKRDYQKALADFERYTRIAPFSDVGHQAIERVKNAMSGR